MGKKRKETQSVLMDLHPCFAGYSGIPQDTRITYSLLSDMEGIELGGHIINSKPEIHGFEWGGQNNELLNECDESSYIIALEGYNIKDKKELNKFFPLPVKSLFKYIRLVKVYVMNLLFNSYGELRALDAVRFQDYIWRNLFAKTLNVEKKGSVLKTRFLGGSLAHSYIGAFLSFGLPQFKINTSGWDVYISQTSFPAKVSDNTKLVVRYYDSIPIEFPHLIGDVYYHQRLAVRTLMACKDRAWFVCISESSRKNLLKLVPTLEGRTAVVNCSVTGDFFEDKEEGISNIISKHAVSELSNQKGIEGNSHYKKLIKMKFGSDYFLCVGTIEPRKNYQSVLSAWKAFRKQHKKKVQLVIVGNIGWNMDEFMGQLNSDIIDGDVFLLKKVSIDSLRKLYSGAMATIIASYAEGFSYSGVESMRCKTPVIASNIEVHEEIYGRHAIFFDPYSLKDLVLKMEEITNLKAKKVKELTNEAYNFSLRYCEENQRKQWHDFLLKL